MPQHLIVKLVDDQLPEVVDLVVSAEDADPESEIARGYQGDGRYAIVTWDDRIECDLSPGPPVVDVVSSPEQRAEAAERWDAALEGDK